MARSTARFISRRPRSRVLHFGGPDLRDIYAASANSTAADFMMPPSFDGSVARGGDTFRVRVEGIRGRPEFRSRIRFPSR
jgi:hypothetical protein